LRVNGGAAGFNCLQAAKELARNLGADPQKRLLAIAESSGTTHMMELRSRGCPELNASPLIGNSLAPNSHKRPRRTRAPVSISIDSHPS
jgi:hypothetical protein